MKKFLIFQFYIPVALLASTGSIEREYVSLVEKLGDCSVIKDRENIIKNIPESKTIEKDEFIKQIDELTCGNPQILGKRLMEIRAIQVNATSRPYLFSQGPKENVNPWLEKNFPWKLDVDCKEVISQNPQADLANRDLWHDQLVQYGHACAIQEYKKLVYQNEKNIEAQRAFEVSSQDKSKVDLKGVRILFVPHYAWEQYGLYELSVKYPWNPLYRPLAKLAMPESVTDRRLSKELEARGAKVTTVWHTSSKNMWNQMMDLKVYVDRLEAARKPYIILSRSSGSEVVLSYIKAYGEPRYAKSWINMFGAPRGSVLPRETIYSPVFFTKVIPYALSQIENISKLYLIPTLSRQSVDSFKSFVTNNLYRSNLNTLSDFHEAVQFSKKELEWNLPVLNLQSFPESKEAFIDQSKAALPPPVLPSMIKHGPSEGSSLITDSSIETKNSYRILFNKDHWIFMTFDRDGGMTFVDQILRTAQSLELF